LDGLTVGNSDPVMMDDPTCPTDNVLLWWKAVAHWIDPSDGSDRTGVWQCHKCRERFILNGDVLVKVERKSSTPRAAGAQGQ
jgi:hypothetical protein